MNRLELCQRARREFGIGGDPGLNTPTTTENQQGELLDLVNYVDLAYTTIQRMHNNWLFRQKQFLFNTVPGKSVYKAAKIADDFQYFYEGLSCRFFNGIFHADGLEVEAGGESLTVGGEILTVGMENEANKLLTEGELEIIPYPDFYEMYQYGASRWQKGPPQVAAINQQNNFEIWPIPDDIFSILGWYTMSIDNMTNNNSEPIFKEAYHFAIIWKALELYSSIEEEINRESKGEEQFNIIYREMCANELPDWEEPDTLA